MQKQTIFKHGVSENGYLQVYRVDQITKDGKVITEKTHPPYSPKDSKNMEGFDPKSVEIVAAIEDTIVKAQFFLELPIPGIKEGLVEEVKWDRMVDDLGRIAVRRITRIYDEGVEVSKKYHRSWIMPGDDLSGKDVISKAVAEKFHTPEVISAYKTKVAGLNEIGSVHSAVIFMTPPLVVAITFALLNIFCR